jgi:hypothetical protein
MNGNSEGMLEKAFIFYFKVLHSGKPVGMGETTQAENLEVVVSLHLRIHNYLNLNFPIDFSIRFTYQNCVFLSCFLFPHCMCSTYEPNWQ